MTRTFIGLAAAIATAASLSAHAHGGHGGHAHGGHGHGQPHFPDAASAAAPEGVTVSDCWIRAMPNGLPSAAYFKLVNTGARDAVLIGAQADGFGRVMLHANQTVGGMASMVHADRVVVPAGGDFDFAPGGHHVMLEKPSADPVIGGKLPIVLWFEGNRAIPVECDVSAPSRMK
ncbi:copper chaperone PCu(A)C [Alcaligenaceae bacterium]|nr:copper chaperone PCu(A)C [Alcaligenaceae bacterium]